MNPQAFFFGNGGGTCKTLDDVKRLTRTPLSHIEVGTITVKNRPGNTGDVFYVDANGTTWNAIGMTNGGTEYYRRVLPEMVAVAQAAGKELIANIAPIDPGDTEKLCELCHDASVRFITFNGGCPNAWAEGVQKKIVSHDPEALNREVRSVFSVVGGTDITVNIKFTPFQGHRILRGEVASVLSPYPVVLLGPNTLPNQERTREENGRPAISFRSGEKEVHVGGMGGTELLSYAIQELEAFRLLLPDHPFISLGAVSKGADVHERLRRGALGVQVTSAYYASGDPHVFSDILTEYAALI